MTFTERLTAATSAERGRLQSAPAIQAALGGRANRALYLAFLGQAYHHVRHTTPLLMALGSRLPERLSWLLHPVAEYIEEEIGHEQWILDDIAAAGGDREAAQRAAPALATEVMVAYAYDQVARRNPVGFFGMVHVLEGTSVALALHAADRLQADLGLPDGAFTYLRSHGTLDQSHTRHLASLLERMSPEDQEEVLHAARAYYHLYGDVFRALPVTDKETSWN
ncbi:MAG: iron-containing redox enzyme family protein [Pseudomonadota bacterium]